MKASGPVITMSVPSGDEFSGMPIGTRKELGQWAHSLGVEEATNDQLREEAVHVVADGSKRSGIGRSQKKHAKGGTQSQARCSLKRHKAVQLLDERLCLRDATRGPMGHQ